MPKQIHNSTPNSKILCSITKKTKETKAIESSDCAKSTKPKSSKKLDFHCHFSFPRQPKRKNANAKTQIRKETESDLSQKEKTYITELEEAEFAEVRDGSVRGLGGDDELDKGHLLGAHQIHGGQVLYELLHSSKFSRETNRNLFFFLYFFVL